MNSRLLLLPLLVTAAALLRPAAALRVRRVTSPALLPRPSSFNLMMPDAAGNSGAGVSRRAHSSAAPPQYIRTVVSEMPLALLPRVPP